MENGKNVPITECNQLPFLPLKNKFGIMAITSNQYDIEQ